MFQSRFVINLLYLPFIHSETGSQVKVVIIVIFKLNLKVHTCIYFIFLTWLKKHLKIHQTSNYHCLVYNEILMNKPSLTLFCCKQAARPTSNLEASTSTLHIRFLNHTPKQAGPTSTFQCCIMSFHGLYLDVSSQVNISLTLSSKGQL